MRDTIDQKIKAGARINTEEALFLYRQADSLDLKTWAQAVRARYHQPGRATYVLMRIINYTNVCVAQCDYCAFYRLPKDPDTYVTDMDTIFAKIDEILALGGDFVGFNGGFNPTLKMEWYEDTFGQIRARYGDHVEFYALTVAELMYIAKLSKMSYGDTAARLMQAGVRWVTGGGSEILTNAFRKRHSPYKYTADDYMDAHCAIIEAGMHSTGTMVIGFDESMEERVEHLDRVRTLQDRCGGKLFSFLSWTYKPFHTELGGQELDRASYWRHLAVSRIFLDNVKHIRTSVLTQNEHALEGLNYGADDFDIPLEDEVTQKAGATIDCDIAGILQTARDKGYEPVFRNVALDPLPSSCGFKCNQAVTAQD